MSFSPERRKSRKSTPMYLHARHTLRRIRYSYIDPTESLRDEGPFGDHTGYYTLPEPYPVFHVTAITHWKDAFYPATIVGMIHQGGAVAQRRAPRTANRVHRRRAALRGDPGVDVFVLLRAQRADHPPKARADAQPGSDPALGFGQRTAAAQSRTDSPLEEAR
jgi:hypothetical protein